MVRETSPSSPRPNPFTVTGAPERQSRPDAWDLLSDEERAQIETDAERWRRGLQESVERVGFASPADYLAATVRRARPGRRHV